MWEISEDHCCATCLYSLEEALVETTSSLICPLIADSLDLSCVDTVLVHQSGRCAHYECDESRFERVHGLTAEEDYDLMFWDDENAMQTKNLPLSFL